MRVKKFTKIEIVDFIVKHSMGILLLIYSFTLLIPIAWMLINSFKDVVDYYLSGSFSFPKTPSFENYKYIFQNMSYETKTPDGSGKITYTLPWMFLYSIIWSFCSPAFNILIVSMCAYVIARYKFPGRKFLYELGIIVMILPIIGASGSALLVRRQLGVYNNFLMMILTGPSAAFSGMNFLILYAAFKAIPWEYAEAVFIDGGGHLNVFLNIMFPMVLPTLLVLVLLGVIGSWNDYMTFMLWLPSYGSIAMGVYKFQYNTIKSGATMPQILAAFVLVSVPIVTLFASFQRAITANFMVGGLKG